MQRVLRWDPCRKKGIWEFYTGLVAVPVHGLWSKTRCQDGGTLSNATRFGSVAFSSVDTDVIAPLKLWALILTILGEAEQGSEWARLFAMEGPGILMSCLCILETNVLVSA